MDTKIQVAYCGAVTEFRFLDLEKARSVYAEISEALKAYRSFSNGRSETVEVEIEDGRSTLKLEGMLTVLLNEPNHQRTMDRIREKMEIEKSIREMRDELGLPPSIVE